MTMFRVGPAGIPGSLKTDMNTVLNKKFGTTGQDYPPADWPADVNLLGPLPIIISTKAPIVSFADGANDVPIEQGTFYVVPSQAGTGTPSPSNPRAISGYTGMTITHTDGQTPPVESETIAVSWQTEAGTVYGGELNVTTGVLTVTHVLKEYAVADMNNSENYPGWKNAGVSELGISSNFYSSVLNIGNGFSVNTNGNNDIVFLPTGTYGMTQTQWQTDYPDLTVQIAVPLATPNEYSLSPISLSTYYGDNNFYCDTGDSQLNYRADISLYINNH